MSACTRCGGRNDTTGRLCHPCQIDLRCEADEERQAEYEREVADHGARW